MYVCTHLFCSITKNVQDFVYKYLSNCFSVLHNVTVWSSTDSIMHLLPCSNMVQQYQLTRQCTESFVHNFLFHSALLDVITKKHIWLSAPSCTLHGGETCHQQLRSLNFVLFVKVRSEPANSSVTRFVCSAASVTVSSTVHKVYCRCVVFKYSIGCNTVFSSVSV